MNKFDMPEEKYIGYLEAKVAFYEAMINKSNFRPFLEWAYKPNNEADTSNNHYSNKPYNKPKKYHKPYKKYNNDTNEEKE